MRSPLQRIGEAARTLKGIAPIVNPPGASLRQAASAIHGDIEAIDGWLMPEEAEALYRLARRFGAVILEIGTFRGRSATVLISGALSRRRWKPAQFFTLDINPSTHSIAIEPLKQRGLADSAVFFHGTLSDFRQQFAICPTLVFVDGDHTYEGAAADIALLSTLLRPGVPVVFHDYLNSDTPGVSRAGDQWCRDGFAKMVRTFGCSAQVMTQAKCSGRKQLLTQADFIKARERMDAEHSIAAR